MNDVVFNQNEKEIELYTLLQCLKSNPDANYDEINKTTGIKKERLGNLIRKAKEMEWIELSYTKYRTSHKEVIINPILGDVKYCGECGKKL
jgi:hypothetical protein